MLRVRDSATVRPGLVVVSEFLGREMVWRLNSAENDLA